MRGPYIIQQLVCSSSAQSTREAKRKADARHNRQGPGGDRAEKPSPFHLSSQSFVLHFSALAFFFSPPDFVSPWNKLQSRKNYLRTFFPKCTLSHATKLFPNQRLCGKKVPSPSSILLLTNAQRSGFLLDTQHCFQGEGERKESVHVGCLGKCSQVRNFLNSFVQDCSWLPYNEPCFTLTASWISWSCAAKAINVSWSLCMTSERSRKW